MFVCGTEVSEEDEMGLVIESWIIIEVTFLTTFRYSKQACTRSSVAVITIDFKTPVWGP